MASDPDQQVENLLDRALKYSNFQALEELLLDETREGKTSKCSKQFISKLDRLIIRELDLKNVKNASVVFTVLHKFGNTLIFPRGEGISAVVSQGLVRKWFEKIRNFWTEAGPLRNEVMINLAEDFFDALMLIHGSCKEGAYQVTESFLHHIGKLASDAQVNVLIQKEAVRKLNVILGKIPGELRKEKKILSSQETSTVMDGLASRILKGGDYDLQVALMEALCRMTSRAQRRELSDRWFSMEFVASAFSNIQDSEFETDCRKFLNMVNGLQGDGRSVYSYPCLKVFLDKHALLMPVDENLKEFWIDFNLGSQSISFYFCLADDQAQEGQWDTLCISENEIYSYTVKEEKDVKVLQLVLSEPVYVSNIEGSRLTIHFSSSVDVLQTAKKVYGEAKNKKFVRKTTTSVVKTTVQIIQDEGGSQQICGRLWGPEDWFENVYVSIYARKSETTVQLFYEICTVIPLEEFHASIASISDGDIELPVLFPESQVSSEPVEKTVPSSVKTSTPFQFLSYHEKDAQHHNHQTETPLRSKVSESCMYVSCSAGRKLRGSPFSCVIPANTPDRKAKIKPSLEMVTSSASKKESELREFLFTSSSYRVTSVSEDKENNKKRAIAPQDRKDHQEAERYRRHIPINRVLEMVQVDQELDERPLDSGIIPDSQPATRKETSILTGLKRISVSESLLPCLQELPRSELSAPASLGTELPQQPSSAQRSSGVLTHKELHAQLTQRLEQVRREQEQQGEPCTALPKEKSSVGLHLSVSRGPEVGPGSVKQSQRPKPAKPTQRRQTKSNDMKTPKATENVVNQISSHCKSTAFVKVAPEVTSQFKIASTNRYIFNKSWCPASAAKTSKFPASHDQSKKPSNQHEDVFEFSVEFSEKKSKRPSEKSGTESSNSLTLSNTAKKHLQVKPSGRNVKKHLFSDTDTDNMTEVSWLKSANRRPRPKVADYTRQPVKPTLPPADTTFESPNMHPPSPKVAKVLPKQVRKRQKKVMEQDKKNKDVVSRKPMDRPQRSAAQIKSYVELTDSDSESETAQPPPAKKLIIKKTEKPQRRDSVQTKGQAKNIDKTSSGALFEQTMQENNQAKSKACHKALKEKAERVPSSPEQSKRKNKAAASMEFTTHDGQKEFWSSRISSFSPPSTNKMRSGEKSAALASSPLISLGLLSKSHNPQKKTVQTKKQVITNVKMTSDGVIEQQEKNEKQPGKTITHSDTDKLIDKKEVGKCLPLGQSNTKKTPAPQQTPKEQSATKLSSCPSPFSIEKMRSADRSAPLTRSPITPLPSFSPVDAVSPPFELPSPLKGIQASSFYKNSVGHNSAKLSLHPSVTPAAKTQGTEEVCQPLPCPIDQTEDTELSPGLSMAQPLIASTGREELVCSSLLNSPDLGEDLKDFLNSACYQSLHASFDKESEISMVTLSQSSHGSINKKAMICTNFEKTPKCTQGSKVEKAEFQSGPSARWKWQSSCKSESLSEDSDEVDDGETKVVPSEIAIKMKPRNLFKPNDKPWQKKNESRSCSSEEEEQDEERDTGKKRRIRGVTKKSSHIPQSHSATGLPQSEISTSEEMGYVCRQFSTELKKKFKNRSRRMDLFTKQSLKAFSQHATSISMQVHKCRSQRLEKIKQVLVDEIKNLEQDDTALHSMEEELTRYWEKQAVAFHSYQEKGSRRLHNLKSAIETNVCHSLEYEEQIFSSEMCLMKKDMKSVQDHLFKQMQEEDLQVVRRGLQILFLPDVPMFKL